MIKTKELEIFIRQIRKDIIEMSYLANAGHVPSALSMADYLSVLFCHHINPQDDILLLAKPYGAQAYYAIFANLGWINKDWNKYGGSDDCWTYAIGREHPLVRYIDDTMGNSLSVACGIALASSHRRVYVNTGDATCQMGTFWEGVAFAGHRKLSNIIMTVDCNNMQVLGNISEISEIEPLVDKFTCFGWEVYRTNGHYLSQLNSTFKTALSCPKAPVVVICDTIKGYGIPFMEGNASWHYETLNKETYHQALKSIGSL